MYPEAIKSGAISANRQIVSPFQRVSEAGERLQSLERRVDDVVTRLVGLVPENGSAGALPRVVPTGILGELDEVSLSMLARIDRMHDALKRLERALP